MARRAPHVLEMLQRWSQVARSSRNPPAHRRMPDHADRLQCGEGIATEPLTATKACLGMWVYELETDQETLGDVEGLPAPAWVAYVEVLSLLEVTPGAARRTVASVRTAPCALSPSARAARASS